jgi:hypothetical protein
MERTTILTGMEDEDSWDEGTEEQKVQPLRFKWRIWRDREGGGG